MSLRKVASGRIEKVGWLFPKWRFHYTKTQYFELSRGDYRRAKAQDAARIGSDGGRVLWWVAPGLYWADDALSGEEVGLLVWDRERRQAAKLDRLRALRAREGEARAARRRGIPAEVRAFVWRRDRGRCQECGAQEDLQFDHIIPVAKGGGGAADNIQILCGDCNRRKSDSVA